MNLRLLGWIGLVGALVAVAVLPVPEFWITQLNFIGIASLAVLGLILLTGVGGLTSFGQAAFVGIGAYSSAYLTVQMGLSPWVTLLVGLAITAACALVLAWITLRMSGHYLPLATLAWGLSLYYTMGNLDALGKYDGIAGLPAISLFGWNLGQGRAMYGLIWALAAGAGLGLLNLLDSRPGRTIRALKVSLQMAESVGVDTARLKLVVFVLAEACGMMCGSLN